MKLLKNELFMRVWIVMAYFTMWYISYMVKVMAYSREWPNYKRCESIWVVLGEHIYLLVLGLVLFLVPYEYIFSWCSHILYEFVELFRYSCIRKGYVNSKHVDIALLGLIYVGLSAFINVNSWMINKFYKGMICCVLTLLAVLMMCQLYDVLLNGWVRYIVSCLLICVANVEICFEFNSKYITAIIVYLVTIISWHVYDSFNKKKIDWFKGLATIAFSSILFAFSLYSTDHYEKLCDYVSPYGVTGNDSSAMMVHLQSSKLLSADFNNNMEYLDHPFIGMNKLLGTGVLALHLVLFVTTIVAMFLQIKETRKKSLKRACLFMSLFLWFIIIYVYKLLCDLGILPESSMTFMGLGVYIPALAILLRILEREEIYKEFDKME